MKQIFLLFLALQLILNSINSQEVTPENYKRAVSFMYDNYNNKTAFNLNTNVNWFKDGSGLWFIDYRKDKKTYKLVDFKNNKVVDLFNHNKMARILTELSENDIIENQLSLSDIEKGEKARKMDLGRLGISLIFP